MSKTFETKRKILRILSANRSTLTEISKQLELAPSTIDKHIKELEADGAIELVDNPYIKKWKYYTTVPEQLDASGRAIYAPMRISVNSRKR